MEAGGEDRCNGEQILCQFVKSSMFGTTVGRFVGYCTLVKNHDFRSATLENVLDEWVCKTAEAVTIGNHNFFESSLQRAFQNGLKAFTLPVDATADVGGEDEGGVGTLEVKNLSIEACLLVVGGDASVAEGFLRFLVLRLDVEHSFDVFDVVESFSISIDTNTIDFLLVGPLTQCRTR